ncbi:MAG: ECF-type sigma factor, partial [Planctomycetota bacterium]
FLSYRKGKLSFESKNELWGFLVRLTTIKCCEKSRYLGCSKRDAKREQGVHYTPEELRQLVSREPSPEDVATFNEVYDQFTSSLSPLQRQIAELKLMDFSNREISERLDRSERTVYRILRQLRTKIAKSSSW